MRGQLMKFEIGLKEKFFAWAIVILGGGLSLALTIQFCVELGGQQNNVMSVAFGVFLEMLKLFCALMGLKLLHSSVWSHKVSGMMTFGLSLLLITVSIAASVGHLASQSAQEARGAMKNSSEHSGLVRKKQTLEETLKSIQAMVAIDAQSQWPSIRRRAQESSMQIASMQSDLDDVTQSLSMLKFSRRRP